MTRADPIRAAAPAVGAACAFVGGVWLGTWSITGLAGSLALCVLSAGLLCLRAVRLRRGPVSIGSLAVFWAAVGFADGRARVAIPAAEARESFQRLPRLPGRADRVEGVLTDFWSGEPPTVRGRLRAERLWDGAAWMPLRADVFLFLGGDAPVAARADRGDRVEAVGHLQAEGIPASQRDLPLPFPVYRLSVKSPLRLENPRTTAISLATWPNRRLFASIPPRGSKGEAFDRDVRGPLGSLLLGRIAELDRGMVGRFRRGGLYHLLVISGLHVALAAGLALVALRALGIAGKPRDLALLAAVALFVVVGGANPPALRAGVVFGVHRIARLLERPVSGLHAIGISALLLFGAAPDQIFSIGAVLTFAAVIGIALFTAPIRRRLPARPAAFFSGWSTALAAQAATAPILLWRFNLVSIAAWLSAPLCVPIAGGLILLGSLLLAGFALGVFASPLVGLFALGSRTLEFLAERASGLAVLRPTPPLALVLAVSALTLLAAIGPVRARAAALACAALLFAALALRSGPAGPARGFSLEALDVGQGDALLLRWNRHAVLIDGGGPFDLDARDFGRTRLLPKLLDRGVVRLDAALLTHPHPDHALGLFAVLQELPTGAFWRSGGQDESGFFRDLEAVANRRAIPVRRLEAGDRVRWSDAELAVLHSGGPRRKLDATNNQSVVALFRRDGRQVLLTGDAGAATEADLLFAGRVPRADLLKVGHHGSRGSTTPEFLAAVAPRVAVISCGRENRFGHPAPGTLATLAAQRVRVFRTDLDSDLRLELSPAGTRIVCRGLFP